jgi:hypothetical protein
MTARDGVVGQGCGGLVGSWILKIAGGCAIHDSVGRLNDARRLPRLRAREFGYAYAVTVFVRHQLSLLKP